MSIVFQVLDVACQQADQSFFVPAVNLTAKSTSKFATVLGYSEFGTPSVPPKKYRTITLQGTSSRVAFTAENPQRQCGGAQYVFSGVGQIDLNGNQISNYSKNFFAQCSKQFWPQEPLQLNPNAITTGGVFPRFVSFCWAPNPSSCAVCDPVQANWPFIGNLAVNVPTLDLAAFLHNPGDAVQTKTSSSVNGTFNGLTSITTDPPNYTSTLFGTVLNQYDIAVGSKTIRAQPAITTPLVDFPVVALSSSDDGSFVDPIFAAYITFTDTNNYSAVLSDEYTDAQALANATTVQGTGHSAQNLPRTTGFTSVTTDVVYTLTCINLISGQNYTVTVDLWDQPANTHTPKVYNFTANSPTQTIIDSIPTPAAGHTITVKSPTIIFSP